MGGPHGSYCLEKTAFASGLKTPATYNSPDISAENHKTAVVTVDATVVVATGTLDVTVERKDPLSGKYITIATFTQITAAGSAEKSIGPGCEVNKNLGKDIRVVAVVGTANVTFSVGVVFKR